MPLQQNVKDAAPQAAGRSTGCPRVVRMPATSSLRTPGRTVRGRRGSRREIVRSPAAEPRQVAATTSRDTGAVSQVTSGPASPGPATSAAVRLSISRLLPTSSWPGVTSEGR